MGIKKSCGFFHKFSCYSSDPSQTKTFSGFQMLSIHIKTKYLALFFIQFRSKTKLNAKQIRSIYISKTLTSIFFFCLPICAVHFQYTDCVLLSIFLEPFYIQKWLIICSALPLMSILSNTVTTTTEIFQKCIRIITSGSPVTNLMLSLYPSNQLHMAGICKVITSLFHGNLIRLS